MSRLRMVRAFVSVSLALGLAGCGGGNGGTTLPVYTSSTSTSLAAVRVVNAVPDSVSVSVTVDGNPLASGVAYDTTSPYVSVSAGSHTVAITVNAAATSGGTPYTTTRSYTTGASTSYTLDVTGELTNSSVASLLTNDNITVPSGKTAIRFVNAAPNSGTVNVFITAPGASISGITPAFSNVTYGTATGLLLVPSGSTEIRVVSSGSVIADSGTATLNSGDTDNAVFAGDAGVGKTPSVNVLNSEQQGRLFVVNAGIPAGIDVTVASNTVIQDLLNQAASGVVPIAAGSQYVGILGPSGSALFSNVLNVVDGSSYLLTVTPDQLLVAPITPSTSAGIVEFGNLATVTSSVSGSGSDLPAEVFVTNVTTHQTTEITAGLSYQQFTVVGSLAPGTYNVGYYLPGYGPGDPYVNNGPAKQAGISSAVGTIQIASGQFSVAVGQVTVVYDSGSAAIPDLTVTSTQTTSTNGSTTTGTTTNTYPNLYQQPFSAGLGIVSINSY